MVSSVFDRGSGGAGTGSSVSPVDGTFLVGDGTSFVGELGAVARTSIGMALLENAIAAPADSNLLVGNGTTWVLETGATLRTSLGLVIGTDVQAWDNDLDDIAALTPTDSNFLVGNGTDWVLETGDTARISLGVGTTDSPQFTAIELGHATDTSITRVSAGVLAVEGNTIYHATGLDVPVTDGGTGSSTAGAARTALGVAIGSDVQAWDINLDEIAALAPTLSNFIVGTGTVWGLETPLQAIGSLGLDTDIATFALPANTTISAFGATLIDDAASSNARTTLGLVIGTNVQAWDAQLDDIAALAETKGMLISNSTSAYVALAVGADATVLTADAAEVSGMKWSATGAIPAAASQAEQETGTSTTVYVSPGRQQFHPGHPKAWGNIDGTGTAALDANFNCSGMVDNAVGDYDFTWDTDFVGDYSAVATCANDGVVHTFVNFPSGGTVRVTDVQIRCPGTDTGLNDVDPVCVAAFGDQA